MLDSILLFVITIILIVNILLTTRKDYARRLNIQQVIANSIHDVFEDEVKEISKAYAEERRLLQWIEELAEKDELDILELSSLTEQRAFALAIKKAEQAVILSETTLAELKREISSREMKMFKDIDSGCMTLVEQDKQILKELIAQEKYMVKRVESEREILRRLA